MNMSVGKAQFQGNDARQASKPDSTKAAFDSHVAMARRAQSTHPKGLTDYLKDATSLLDDASHSKGVHRSQDLTRALEDIRLALQSLGAGGSKGSELASSADSDQASAKPKPDADAGSSATDTRRNSGGTHHLGNSPQPARSQQTQASRQTAQAQGSTAAQSGPPGTMKDDDGSGHTNVAGRDHLDPDKPIFVPIKNGHYDQQALDAIAKQGLHGINPIGNDYSDHAEAGDPGHSDGHKWEIANGIAQGIPYGAAIVWAAQRHGYTTNKDLKAALVQPMIESGSDDGSHGGRPEYRQKGGPGMGLSQIDPRWHNTTNAFNPFHNEDLTAYLADKMGKTMGGTGHYTDDEIVYNNGKPGDGQTVYHQGVKQSYRSATQMFINQIWGDDK